MVRKSHILGIPSNLVFLYDEHKSSLISGMVWVTYALDLTIRLRLWNEQEVLSRVAIYVFFRAL